MNVKCNVGSLIFLSIIMAWCIWYLIDTISAGWRLQNLMLILPAFIVICVLFTAIFLKDLSRAAHGPDKSQNSKKAKSSLSSRKLALLFIVFGVYILAMPEIGFDLSSFLFLAIIMLVLGERRYLFIVVYSAIFSTGLSLALVHLMTYPTNMLIF